MREPVRHLVETARLNLKRGNARKSRDYLSETAKGRFAPECVVGGRSSSRNSGWKPKSWSCGINRRSRLRAPERDEDIPGPTLCLERSGPTLVQVWRVVASRQRVAVQAVNSLPRLAL